MPRFLTLPDVAEELQISVGAARNLVQSGELGHFKLGAADNGGWIQNVLKRSSSGYTTNSTPRSKNKSQLTRTNCLRQYVIVLGHYRSSRATADVAIICIWSTGISRSPRTAGRLRNSSRACMATSQ